jgi:hypothetical protein
MRHVFLVVPALALMAGFGVDQLLARWRGRTSYRLAPAVLCAAIGWSGWQVVECHPYEAYYLNEPVRALIPGPKLADYFDFYGWGSVYTQGVQWVNAHAPLHATVALGDKTNVMLPYYGLRKDLRPRSELDQADYVLVGGWCGGVLAEFHSAPVYCIHCYGVDLLCVFANNGK